MEKEKARILLPDGQIIERMVTSVLRQIGPTCVGAWHHTIQYKGKKCEVEEYSGDSKVKYVLRKQA